MPPLELNTALDIALVRQGFAQHGRVQIGNFLSDDSAQALLDALVRTAAWKLTYNRGDRVHDHSRTAYMALDADERRMPSDAIIAGGRAGFQFCYDTIRSTPDGNGPLETYVRFMNSPAVVDLLRTVTGADDITTVDGHASRYGPGQFLTTHDDRIDQRGRRAAYVMNLTPHWHPDWGGLLLFYDAQGNVVHGYTPRFNALNLFAVPQPHSVSWVTPLASGARISVTGWLLAESD